MRFFQSFVLITAASLTLMACQSEKIDNSMLVNVNGVSFSSDVLPIFQASCGGNGCHINESISGVNLTNYASTIGSVGNQYNEAVVKPGDGAGSALVDKLGLRPQFGLRMPDGRPALAANQIAAVRTWIDEGALDN